MKKNTDIKLQGASTPLQEGLDFYWEGCYVIFTEHYLLARNQCCGSGCRHCPYRKKRTRKTEA
ncbi:MAG: hypothetical protein IPL65_03095 [Lewinellaceae bacterium]|nr:hypothetical protein [Lewinellaceae bacterium]